MKDKWKAVCRYWPWLVLLLGIDGLSALLLWLSDSGAFSVLAPVMLLVTVFLFGAAAVVLGGLERKKQVAFRDFLEHPDQWHEENLVKTVSGSEADCVRLLGKALREKQLACARAAADMEDYEEYVEAWAHEIKTPLSLLTLMLDNQRGDMPESMDYKLDYIRNQMQEYVNQMLYYARLKSVRKDYLFEFVDLRDCLEEVLEDYRLLLEEKQFLVQNQVPHTEVFTDRRGLQFLLGQVVSNAVKYSSADPELALRWETKETEAILRIRDNGMGVRTCDLPYIFEKGFTGDPADGKKKATGMGLYLVKKMADDLRIRLDVWSEWDRGFELSLSFPLVEKEDKILLDKKIFECRIHPIKGKGALEHHLRGAFLFIHTNTFTVQRRASRERYHL